MSSVLEPVKHARVRERRGDQLLQQVGGEEGGNRTIIMKKGFGVISSSSSSSGTNSAGVKFLLSGPTPILLVLNKDYILA